MCYPATVATSIWLVFMFITCGISMLRESSQLMMTKAASLGRARLRVQAPEAGYTVEKMQALESAGSLLEYQLPSFIAFWFVEDVGRVSLTLSLSSHVASHPPLLLLPTDPPLPTVPASLLPRTFSLDQRMNSDQPKGEELYRNTHLVPIKR